MGKRIRSRAAALRACLALTILMGVALFALPAYAETLTVSGADHTCASDAQDSSVDVLTVTGQKGETVYINMKKGDKTLASHLAFTLDDSNAETDANGDMVGAVSVEFSAEAFSYNDTYTIEVFADRAETKQLYTGTVSTLFANYEDAGATEALIVRTLAQGEDRPLTVPNTRDYKGVTYELKSQDPQNIDGKQCYVYQPSKDLADSIEGHVYYYDVANASGDPIKTQTFTLEKGKSQQVALESIVSAESDGALYRTLQLSDSVTVAYPGTSDYSIMCMKLSNEWGKAGSFFKATINYTDVQGNKLGVVDNVIVNKTYLYTPPTNLYVNESGTVKEYVLASNNEALNAQGALELKPGMATDAADFNIVYEPVADDAERTWTVVLENGSVSPKDANRVIDRITYRGKPGDSATHTTKEKISVGGVDYVPTAAAQQSYSHTFGVADMDVEQTIYYVPDGYVAPEAYDITVKYVNIANNEVISTETYTASPSMRADLEITSPESFSQGGIEWIRLNGQESPLRHGFYDATREYTIYYRDINDDLHANTIIRTVRVVYVDEEGNTITRPTTVIDNGTTDAGTTDEGTTAAAAAGEGEGTATGLQTGADLMAIDGANGSTLVGEDGTDLATTRIEDEETPLANLDSVKGAAKVNPQALVIGGVVAAVAAGLIIFFVYKRRKKDADDTSDEDLSA